MLIPIEREFILHNFDKAMTLDDRMTQSKIFADTQFQTYQVENALNEYRMLLYLQLETLKDKFNPKVLSTLFRVIRCLLPTHQYE